MGKGEGMDRRDRHRWVMWVREKGWTGGMNTGGLCG